MEKNNIESTGAGSYMFNSFKKAFTLAEILITLAIIGVVAAITIPTVANKVKNEEFYARFIRTYNTFNNVYFQLKTEGVIDNLSISQGKVLEKLKYTVKCEANDVPCFGGGDVQYKALSGGIVDHLDMKIPKEATLYSLPNGADFSLTRFNFGNDVPDIFTIKVDTNGIAKGPNIAGRDYFIFLFYPYQTFVGFDEPATIYDGNWKEIINSRGRLVFSPSKIRYSCNSKDNSTMSAICGARLLLDKKMDY